MNGYSTLTALIPMMTVLLIALPLTA